MPHSSVAPGVGVLNVKVAVFSVIVPVGPPVISAIGRSGARVEVRTAAYSDDPAAVVCEAVSFCPSGSRSANASDHVPSAATVVVAGTVGSV